MNVFELPVGTVELHPVREAMGATDLQQAALGFGTHTVTASGRRGLGRYAVSAHPYLGVMDHPEEEVSRRNLDVRQSERASASNRGQRADNV